jgi:hypothetical protein
MAITLDGSNLTTSGVINRGTAVASTSGTSIDFTGIPIGASRITVMFAGVSGSGTSIFLVQIGTSSGIQNTGYASVAQASSTATAQTTGFGILHAAVAANTYNGVVVLSLLDSSTGIWTQSGNIGAGSGTVIGAYSSGSKTLSGTLDRVRITTVNGTDTFDAGSINILYE